MIPAAPFDHQTGKGDCERCEEERRIFWKDMGDMADEDAADDLLAEIQRDMNL